MDDLTIEMPVHLWHRVDGCVDNAIALDVVEGIIEPVIAGSCVRDVDLCASAAYSGERDERGCPPPERLALITHRRSHWGWTLAQSGRWEPCETDGVVADARAVVGKAIRRA